MVTKAKYARMTEEQKERYREHTRKYRANLTEEQKQRDRETKRKWYANQPEEQKQRVAETKRKWYANLTEEQKQRIIKSHRISRANMTEEQKEKFARLQAILSAKKRAKKHRVPFSITLDYINEIWPDDNKCPVLGIPFVRGSIGKKNGTSPNLDRIVPADGYTIGNIKVMSGRANRIKSDATAAEVMIVAQYLVEQERERAST
mgnify:FL=1|tara:strand:- start:20 stop:631 length:612 start_codon:yes stop_codon:yes gene_type:complete